MRLLGKRRVENEHRCFRRIIRHCERQTSVENRFSIELKSENEDERPALKAIEKSRLTHL